MPEAQENTPVTNPDIVIGGRQFSNPNNLQPKADDESPGTPVSNPIPNWKKDRGVAPSSTEYTSALADRGQPREGAFEDTEADKKEVQDLLNDEDAWKEESFNNTQSRMRRASGPVVAVPGVGNVQFPVRMEMDKIHAAAKKLYDGAAKLASNASQAIGGPSNLADATQGTVAGLSHPVETGKTVLKSLQNIPAEHGRLLLKARDAWKAGDKEAAAQHFFNSLIPLVGPTSDRAGEQLKKGDYVAGAGTTLGAILPLLFGGESGAAVAEKAESGLSEAGEAAAPKANAESAPKPAAKVETVGSAAAAKADTDFFQQAKTELGSNASISKIAQRAQELKVASKQVSINASGESAASLEAINRVSSERSRGIKRFRVDTRSGKEIPIVGADAVDATAGPYDVILQRGPEGEVILDTGSKARPLGKKSSASQTAGSLLAGTGGVVAQRASKTDKSDNSLDQLLSKYSDAPDTYSKIIAFRKQAKNMDPDERASVEKQIANYSNALNRANLYGK